MKVDVWACVDKDGTEKLSNNVPMRRKGIISIMWGMVPVRYTKNQYNKWTNMWSNEEEDTLPFMGVEVPKGTIEKLIGRKLTWKDEPVKL